MNYAWFATSEPAMHMFDKLGILYLLEMAGSWRELRELVVDFNGADRGRFVDRVRDGDGVCSSGERVLLHAICYACDFAWLADELAGNYAWRNMNRASGDHLRAVAACIEAWE